MEFLYVPARLYFVVPVDIESSFCGYRDTMLSQNEQDRAGGRENKADM